MSTPGKINGKSTVEVSALDDGAEFWAAGKCRRDAQLDERGKLAAFNIAAGHYVWFRADERVVPVAPHGLIFGWHTNRYIRPATADERHEANTSLPEGVIHLRGLHRVIVID